MQQALLGRGSNRKTAAGGLKEGVLERCACAPQDMEQLRQTPMYKSDHNGYWSALERSKLVRLGVRNRSQ